MASVARRHGMNDNIIFTWRKRFRDEGVDLLPVMVSPGKLAPAIGTANRAGAREVAPLVWTDFAVAARVTHGRLWCVNPCSQRPWRNCNASESTFERRVWSNLEQRCDRPVVDEPGRLMPHLP